MDASTINRWVKSFGLTYEELVAKGDICNQPMTKLYDDSEWLTLTPESGLELDFWAESKRLEKVLISLIPTEKDDPVYTGQLPAPFSLNMDQAGVRAILGEPMESKGPVKLPGGLGMRGGWDAYRLQEKTHQNVRIGFSYTADMKVKTLAFTLLNPNHN